MVRGTPRFGCQKELDSHKGLPHGDPKGATQGAPSRGSFSHRYNELHFDIKAKTCKYQQISAN